MQLRCIFSHLAEINPTTLSCSVQAARGPRGSTLAVFRHLGALGLFSLGICAIAAAAGSVIAAYITFSLAREAGRAYLDSRFGQRRVPKLLKFSTAGEQVPLLLRQPFPSRCQPACFLLPRGRRKYQTQAYSSIVGMSRLARYSAVTIVGERYGRHVIPVLRHPVQNWSWFLLVTAIFVALVVSGIIITYELRRRTYEETLKGSPVTQRVAVVIGGWVGRRIVCRGGKVLLRGPTACARRSPPSRSHCTFSAKSRYSSPCHLLEHRVRI